MTCHDVQLQLSLYLYGELDFASEEALEEHLSDCAFCQQALAREKTWHTAAASEHRDVSLDFLASCRQDLRRAIAEQSFQQRQEPRKLWQWPSFLRISTTPFSYQLAAASFLVFLGFAGARMYDRYNVGQENSPIGAFSSAGLVNPLTRIRDIQPNGSGQVKILLDQVNQREIVGSLDDQNVRRLVLVASKDLSDPGIRVDSVELLSDQNGADVRDALLSRIESDPNPAVRLKALEAIRRFSNDPATRNVLRSVLEHDNNLALRSEAIDVLIPVNQSLQMNPELAIVVQNLARSESDDYVRERCLQILRAVNAPMDAY
jgi:hypothetical protein